MAKARPSLDITARPVSTFVAPNQNAVAAELYDQQTVQNALQFADAFSNLSVSAARLAGALKQQSNEEEILKGQDLVNQSRRSYQQLVSEGQIKPTENPWFAIGAQKASGTMEAAKARANFETLLEKKIQEDPNFLDDPRGFDAFAYQYTQNVNQFIGDASYMSRSFYESFNPFVGAMQSKHEQRVIEHNQSKILVGVGSLMDQAVSDFSNGDPKNYQEMYTNIQTSLDNYALSGVPAHQVNIAAAARLIEQAQTSDNPQQAMDILNQLKAGTGRLADVREVKGMLQRANPKIQDNISRLTDAEYARITTMMDENILIRATEGYISKEEGQELVRREALKMTNARTADSLVERFSTSFDRAQREQEAQLKQSQENTYYTLLREVKTNGNKDELLARLQAIGFPPAEYDRAEALFEKRYAEAEESRQQEALWQATNVLWNGTGNGDGILPDLNTALSKATAPNDSSIPDFGKYATQIDQFATRSLGMVPTETKYKEYRLRASQQLQDSIDRWTAGFAPAPNDTEADAAYKSKMRSKGLAMQMSVASRFDDPSRLEPLYRDVLQELNPQIVESDKPMPALEQFIQAYKFAQENNQNISSIMPTGENGKAMIQMMDYALLRVRSGENLRAVAQDVSQMMSLNAPFGEPINLKDPLNWTDKYGTDGQTKLQVQEAVNSLHEAAKESGGGELDPDSIPYLNYVFRSEYIQEINGNPLMARHAGNRTLDKVLKNYAFVRGSILPRSALGPYKSEAYVEAWLDTNFPNNPNATLVVLSPPGAGEAIFGVRERGQPVSNKYYTINDIVSPTGPEGRKVFEQALDKAVLMRKPPTSSNRFSTPEETQGWLWRDPYSLIGSGY